MDFEAIKAGFQSYLTEKLAEEGSENTVINSSVSIFEHSSEFKDYLVEEVGADVSIFTKSINEIMEMDFVNGKFVEPEDETSEEDGGESSDTIMTDILNEALSYETVINAYDADGSGDLSEDEVNTFLSSAASEETGEISLDSLSETITGIQESSEEETVETTQEEDAITTLLNSVYENKTVIRTLDTDGDGELSDEEKAMFEEFIKGYDGDDTSLSEDDIKSAVTEIIKGTFSYETETAAETEINEEITEETTDNTDSTGTSETTSSGSNGSTGSVSSGTSSGSGTASSSKTTQTSEKSLDNMTLSELESEKDTRQEGVNTARENINAVYSGENEAVAEAEANCEEAREAYDEAVENDENISEDLKERREENLDAIENEEDTIDGLKTDINDKEGEISEQEDVISNDEATISGYKSSLSSLKSQSSDDEDTQAEIDAAIQELESAIDAAEEQLAADEDKLEELEGEKADLEEQLEEEEGKLEELENERSEIEAEILANCSEETKAALEAYNEAKDNVSAVKEEQLAAANEALTEAQASLDEVNEAINVKKEEEAEKEFAVNDSSLDADLVEALDAKLGEGFCAKLEEICEELGCNPKDLLGLMYSESGLNPSAVNSSSGATGLIQFIPSTAASLGTTTSELKNMSAVEQLDYVKEYLEECNFYGYDEIDAGTLYAMVFLPGYANSEVLCESGSKYYSANKGLDIDGDGQITKSDLAARVENLYQTVLDQYT